MTQKIKQFIGGFLITAIVIGAMCGFMIVDMSTDRYMPDRFGPMFLITSLGAEGMEFSFMGEEYTIGPLARKQEAPPSWHGLLPLHMQVARLLGEQAYSLLEDDAPADEEEQVLSVEYTD